MPKLLNCGVAVFVLVTATPAVGTSSFLQVRRDTARKQTSIPLVLLKLGHTGSSWLTREIVQRPHTYLIEEAFNYAYQTNDTLHLSDNDEKEYVVKALTRPMGRFGYRDNCFHSDWKMKRYGFEGYTKSTNDTLNCIRKLWGEETMDECVNIHGFTMEPAFSALGATEYAKIFAEEGTHVMVLNRTNVVKHALSWLKVGENGKQELNLDIFRERLYTTISLNLQLGDWISAFEKAGVDMQYTNYEELQINGATFEVNRMLMAFGIPEEKNMASSSTSKSLSDNVRDSVTNFDELELMLREVAPCLVDQLHATEPIVFSDPTCSSVTLARRLNLGYYVYARRPGHEPKCLEEGDIV